MNPNINSSVHKLQNKTAWRIAPVVAAGTLLVGCQNPELTRWFFPLVGLAGGALVAKYYEGTKWAAGGAALGGALGMVAGQIVYEKQMDLETRKNVLNASISDAKTVLGQSKAYNSKLQKMIDEVQAALNKIEADLVKNRITAGQAKELKVALVPALETLSQEARQTGRTFEDYTKGLEASEKRAQLLKEIQDLNAENAELENLLQKVAAQRTAAAGA